MKPKTKKPSRLKAAVLGWLGVPVGLTDETFWHKFGTNVAGQSVNECSVLKLSAVWACARLIAETISTLPLGLYEKTARGRLALTEHPLYSIIHSRPNPDSTAVVFWEAMIVSMLLRGNGFAEKNYIGKRMVSMDFLAPGRLSITRDINGNRKYRYTEKNGTRRDIPAKNIFRIPGFTIDGDWGLSAIEYGSQVFGSALAAGNAANSTFEKGLAPTVAFTMQRVLNKEQRTEFRESLAEVSGAINAGKSPLLEGGMDAKTIGINPKDAQLLESRAFSVEEICRWFRVPPFMVGQSEKSSSWGTGIEQQMIGFLTFTLRPWLTRIEQAINKDLLSLADQMTTYAEFSVEGLLRADSKGRAEYLASMVNNGLMTRDEGRAKDNLPLMGGNADVLTVQTALIPLDQLGKAPAGN
ncbi:TPA: phage portal protein [Pseudomonas aeruginosa]|uniref:phage portal protein n=1 Tax=Pseudomonas TaxID=286 RepID=UPI00053DB9A2|nr:MULTISPECIES: phage portal protein [Pseudomonas]EIU2604393.1 phage portal protein [Pseudomonas aeruginosa]EIU2847223.1 phage portal protein [Pseudomonas aeruginosa]EIU4412580.1 phage portal protein [Pseudomonas aeruginosa]EKV0252184.1 phage portal protein [Pseudomonas aeruginosa]EMC9352642.1 phage portal protein [Pseudomonas aeruginosa]